MTGKFAFVVVAGGVGKRAGASPLPKQFLELGGKPMWLWSVLTAAKISEISEIVVVAPSDFVQNMKSVCETEGELKGRDVKVVRGGKERADSVRNGLFSCSAPFVLIHDAARPFVSEALIRRLMAAVGESTGAIPLVPVADAVKKLHPDGTIEPVNRDGLFSTQTPQAFPRERLIAALENAAAAGINPKDEAEAWGASPLFNKASLAHIPGERLNFKITFPEDFMIAEAIAKCREPE